VRRWCAAQVGPVSIGSDHRIALQTMTTSDTRDVEASVAEVKRCADAGADLVRLTVQGKREAEACYRIRERLFQVRACFGCRFGSMSRRLGDLACSLV
jgi:4-hydroxy-3-methylbut-2-en-1-yl diphosphate synthase IspG/GcpE